MATNLLNNCHFDLTKITNLFLGNILFTGGTIQYPIEIQTLAGSVDSIIAYSDVNAVPYIPGHMPDQNLM